VSLGDRKARFNNLSAQFQCTKPGPMIAVTKINKDLFRNLQIAVALYLSKCLPEKKIILDEKKLLAQFALHRGKIKNCTPNGVLMPKRHLILEYNIIIQAYAAILKSLGISEFIESILLNIRYKDAEEIKGNRERSYPTEEPHTDAWVGQQLNTLTVITPIFGDAENNRVDYFRLPDDFKDEWLAPLPTFASGRSIADKCRRLKIPFQKGKMYLTDISVVHGSVREPGAGARVSIDAALIVKKLENEKNPGLELPNNMLISFETFCTIGENNLFVFTDSEDRQSGSSDFTVVKLQEDRNG